MERALAGRLIQDSQRQLRGARRIDAPVHQAALLAGCQAERWNSQYSFSLSTERFYGTDMGVRDLFGNAMRILQPKGRPQGDGLTVPAQV